MRAIQLFILLLFTPLLSFANAKSTQVGECVPADHMTEIARDFSQFRQHSGKTYCFDGSHVSNLLTGLYFMRKTSFDQSMNKSSDDLFSGRFASDWYGYFTQRVKDISIDSSCPKRVGAYVYPWGSTMYVCTFMLSDVFTGLDRASVFMHEARHLDGYPHTTCRSGPRAGLRGACDTRISDGGSYAVTVETYAQLARYAQNIHPAMKAYSRASAVVYADEAFDRPATVNREQHFLLMAQDKNFHSLDMQNQANIEQLGISSHLGHIVMRAQMMVLLPDDKTQPAQYVFANNEGLAPQQPGTTTEDYNKATPDQRAEVVDFHVASQWDARVFKDRVELKCNPRSDNKQTLPFAVDDVPTGIVYLDGYARENKFIHLQMESGSLYKLGCQTTRQAVMDLIPRRLDRLFKRIHKSGPHYLGLGFDGMVYEIVGDQSTHVPTALDGQVHELAPMQSFMFFDN